MSNIVIRVIPGTPTSGLDFTAFLNDLTITAFDISFGNLEGAMIGEASYLAPEDEDSPHIPNPNTGIVQHVVALNLDADPEPELAFPVPRAVATAVIEVDLPASQPEHKTSDIRLEITRGGGEIIHRQIHYNVPVAEGDLPDPNEFQFQEVTSLYLFLPPPAQQLDSSDAYVELPEDGTPPNFADLRAAVIAVLENDPEAGNFDLAALTPQQSRHIAKEIVPHPDLHPLPQPPRPLDQLYTEPDEDEDNDRRRFEGELQSYHAIHNATAERLASYVFALSAAEANANTSNEATEAGLNVRVQIAETEGRAKIKAAKITLVATGATLDPSFTIPADYFYVLGAILSLQSSREQRYKLATLADEQQTVDQFTQAIDDGIMDEPAAVNRFQAARRLVALGATLGSAPTCELPPAGAVHNLVQAWLDSIEQDIANFWEIAIGVNADGPHTTGHLELILCALTRNYQPLIDGIIGNGQGELDISNVSELADVTAAQWRALFLPPGQTPRFNLLPQFTLPGTAEERTAAFISHVSKFFDVSYAVEAPPISELSAPPTLHRPTENHDPFQLFAIAYNGLSGSDFVFGSGLDGFALSAINEVFPDDAQAQAWLEEALRTIDALWAVTDIVFPPPAPSTDPEFLRLRFSIVEALFSRGFTRSEDIANLTLADFREALIGTIGTDVVNLLHANAGELGQQLDQTDEPQAFSPINTDGCLVNCIPPPHLSPLGPIAYLHELLDLSELSTCERPFVTDVAELDDLIGARCGPLGDLLVTRANLETPLPWIDLVNECLEALASTAPAPPPGIIHNTAGEELAGHTLCVHGEDIEPEAFCHDPATLFEALPEHSSPATPVVAPDAYENLRNDFSHFKLPYSQPLDINRTYLNALGTNRCEVMRTFRRDITNFVLDPDNEPADFQRHLWRYPVRREIACECLGFSPEECDLLFTQQIAVQLPANGRLLLWQLYGFLDETVDDVPWTTIVVRLLEFLERTGLSYCEFFELWQSGFVEFRLFRPPTPNNPNVEVDVPECEPCDLDEYRILFINPGLIDALLRLAIFIRLWRTLKRLPGANYSFAELRDIAEVLQLFDDNGEMNPRFIEELAAFQMLRDDFGLALVDKDEELVAGATGADRTHLLAQWIGPDHAKWSWAVDELLDQVQRSAVATLHCPVRHPGFIKLLGQNLDPLSRLVGFDPDNAALTWHALPTHTLRLAEILTKIYASSFGVGEILCLFTVAPHLHGDDPFPLQTENEALCDPLALPDDSEPYLLWDLRDKLRAVEVADEEIATWTWPVIETTLQQEFGYEPPASGTDPLHSLGAHFFHSILEASGQSVDVENRQYRVDLPLASPTAPLMWNTPPEGPFRYDPAEEQLWTVLPLTDESVLHKLHRIRQLNPSEQFAVRQLYYLPRVDLTHFAFIFPNFEASADQLLHTADETERWAYFQRAFALFYARCRVIAMHLAEHVEKITGKPNQEGHDLAWLILRHLFADENRPLFASWENDSGEVPDVFWRPQPKGGAFAALLGLLGTGLYGEYVVEDDNLVWEDDTLLWDEATPVWREVRGPMEAFGSAKNDFNGPVVTFMPSMNLSLPPEQLGFVGVRNGFAIANTDGEMLGGIQGFGVHWEGLLLIENSGTYTFMGGGPTPEGETPDFEAAEKRRWRVTLKQGQKIWTLLSHQWPDTQAPATSAAPLALKRGAYELSVEFLQPAPVFDGPEDVCPQTTGFQLKYIGPDSQDQLITIPHNKLLRDKKDLLQTDIDAAVQFQNTYYTSTARDIRRTYQRVFKALLFAHRFQLSAQPIADSGQSELGYMLSQPDNFLGTAYYQDGLAWDTHLAFFNFNFLPLLDNYYPPEPPQDIRVEPTPQRQQALFDWWERIFDYVLMRQETQAAPERPVWLLFHEASELHPDDPAPLLRHMGVDLRHTSLVLRYYQGYDVSSEDLEDDRWSVRVWQAEKLIRVILQHFLPRDIRQAGPDLWASDDPILVEIGETESGNANLTRFYRDGCIENGAPRRYVEIKQLNDGLRERARKALIAYLSGMDRVALPWGGFAEMARDFSDLLLMDVEVGICQKASRIEAAVSIVHAFIQRARLGLEPGFSTSQAFTLLWDSRFADFYTWEACTRRTIYRENWIEWDKQEQARRGEGYRFLEAELRRGALTVPVPGGLEYWPDQERPQHPGIVLLQGREAATLNRFTPTVEGFGLLGTPERDARQSLLAAAPERLELSPPDSTVPPNPPGVEDASLRKLPLWIQAAIQMDTRFIRVAAASEPPAVTEFAPRPAFLEASCCVECGKLHPPNVDEYYFWLVDSRHFTEQEQNADWGISADADVEEGVDNLLSDWHRPERLPDLLHWESEPMVHLTWCRVHNGEFQQPRRSHEGVRINPAATDTPQLVYLGRGADSLFFQVTEGVAPIGFPAPPPLDEPEPPAPVPGFRYDMAPDEAVVLPEIALAEPEGSFIDNLPAYPYFAFFQPGVPLFPTSLFSPVLMIAAHLRAHCSFESALKWYACYLDPLQTDLSETWCEPDTPPVPPPVPAPMTVLDDLAQERATILHYLETLLQWGDALMRHNTPEAFQQARVIFDTAARILGKHPKSIIAEDSFEPPQTVASFVPLAAPLNPRLLAVYDQVSDRQALIHNCLNAYRLRNGQPNKHMPYWGNNPQRKDWLSLAPNCHGEQVAPQPCLDDADWCCPSSSYRFLFLVQKALELVNEVRGLGTALLSAYEKGDAEYLASLRASHDQQLLNLTLEIRQHQWREADWQEQSLQKAKEIAQTRLRYFETLIENGLISDEELYRVLTGVSLGFRTASNVSETIAQGISIIPDLFPGITNTQTWVPIGTKLGGVLSIAARVLNTVADINGTTASLRLTEGGWERREDEWQHQVEVLRIEIEQIERQILAASRRRDIALRELNNHQRQIENSSQIYDFLRDKLTNHALYLWLQQETAALYYQMYELALSAARQAQRAYNHECGHTQRNFLSADVWDNLHEGLLAGDRLQLALRQMEKAYLDKNSREYELTKHISLRHHFPLEFLQLLTTGRCEIEVPEWMFDQDYPGQYMRRIKNVTLTLPAVVGPYTGIHCRLTLLSSITRVDPYLIEPPADCCNDDTPSNSYEPQPDDPRIVKQYCATEAIATSSGQNDAGMFELNFRDERYLPFECEGAVSCWRIELPPETNYFDIDSVSDVIMHLNYTAREGGEVLRTAAMEVAQAHLPGDSWRLFEIDQEFPQAWHQFMSDPSEGKLNLELTRNMFPFLPGRPDLALNKFLLFFAAPGAEPSAHRVVEFLAGNSEDYADNSIEWSKCDLAYIPCIATDDWPKLFFGVHQAQLGSFGSEPKLTLGTFRFPQDTNPIKRAYLVVGYDVS